jgi:cytochrome c biogenesis protein CcmG/thiol:disulfide interchange protein DsbE
MSYLVRSFRGRILYQVSLSVILVSGGMSAAGQVKSAKPDPREIVSASAKAVQQVKSVSYDATFETVFGQRATVMKGTVEIERGGSSDAALAGRLHIKSDGFGGAQEVTFDGKIARRLVHEKKLLTEGLVDKGGITVARNSSTLLLLFWTLIEAEPLKYERAATSAEYLGLASVDGVLCHVIDLQYEVPGTDVRGARWWFAVEDKLPRRFQKTVNTATGKTIQELRVSNLQLGNGIAESSFRIDLPSGYSYQPFVPGKPPKPISIGEMAPDWTLLDASGKQHRVSDYRGRILVLNFWASWCGYCKLGIPAVQKLYEKYKGRGVAVLGVSFQEVEGVDPEAYLKTRGADFPTLLKGETIAGSYGVEGVPAYYVIDPNGRVAYAVLQYNPNVPAELEDVIEKHLSGQTKP